jgi:hypothetical protein
MRSRIFVFLRKAADPVAGPAAGMLALQEYGLSRVREQVLQRAPAS